MADTVDLLEVDLDEELSKVASATKEGMDAGTISAAEGLQVNTLCCIAAMLLEVGSKLDSVHEVLCEISDQLNEE